MEMEGRLAGQAERDDIRCNDLQLQLEQSRVECKRLTDREDEIHQQTLSNSRAEFEVLMFKFVF